MKKFLPLAWLLFVVACKEPASKDVPIPNISMTGWRDQFDKTLPLLGHRNWIIVADKAFPEQNAAGIEYINTNEELLPVLKYVLDQVNKSGHVKPIIYRDKELGYLPADQVKGIEGFRSESEKILNESGVEISKTNSILHDSVFTKLDAASKLFKVLVLKTNGTMPYTSFFLQLDCAYWNPEQEKQLRQKMSK